MDLVNKSNLVISYSEFILFGFPGVIEHRKLLVLPFLSIYLMILTGNIVIIHRICVEVSLHSPMYFLISVLFSVNLSCTTLIIPRFLLGLSFDMNQISLLGCLLQMFYIYFMAIFESGLVLSMALDRYVAICRPLRYNDIMTNQMLYQLLLIGVARGIFFATPMVALASGVYYCKSNIILNFVCENMGLLSLACEDISKLQIVGLIVRVFITVMDGSLLLLSYSTILFTAMKIIAGKARRKALHTCGTHLLVATIMYMSALSSSVVYRLHMLMPYDIQNLFNAIYLMIPATINPFIYGLGVKDIRQCLIRAWKKRNEILFPTTDIQINRTYTLKFTAGNMRPE